jgi:hypothetical protein
MVSKILLIAGVVALGLLAILLFLATIPLVWYLLAALLFFSGLIGPAFGCLVLGVLVSVLLHGG